MTASHDGDREDGAPRTANGTDEGEYQSDSHARPEHEGLPFGENPQELQGEDPASGGS